MSITIISDHKWKPFRDLYEVPRKILKSQFDYQADDTVDGFLRYRGYWYHLDMFLAFSTDAPESLLGWEGYHADSYFSAVLIKVSSDGEQYQIATAIQ